MERHEYLKFRNEDDQAAILAAFFSERIGYEIDKESFIPIMWMAIEDDTNLQERIDNLYPLILKYYDAKFCITFIIRDYGEGDRQLLTMY